MNAGRIEIRYSAVHISEITHTSPEAAAYSARRAEILSRLSNGKCMRMNTDIFEDELIHHFDDSHSIQATSENNQWLDTDILKHENFLDNLLTSVRVSMKERGYNRKARRAVKMSDLRSRILHTEEGTAVIKSIIDNINRKFPLDRELDRPTLLGYIAGDTSSKEFRAYMSTLLTDPVSLIARIAREYDTALRIPRMVRDIGLDQLEGMNRISEQLSTYFCARPSNVDVEQARKQIERSLTETKNKVRRKSIRETLLNLGVKNSADLTDAQIDEIHAPTIDVLLTARNKFFKNMISAAEFGKPMQMFSISDAADLMHAQYLAYVGVFRCDGAWADILRPIGMRFNTDVVGKVEDLLPTIEKRLSAL